MLIASTQIIVALEEISSIDRAQLDFAVNLLKKTAEDGKSTILSPASVSASLFMLYLATNDRTKQQLHDVLGGTASTWQLQGHFHRFFSEINSRNKNYTLDLANRLYVEKRFSITRSFERILPLYYEEDLNKFSFNEKNEIVKDLNNWISTKTNNKINDIISADSITSDTVMLLANAIYFKGTWKTQFMAEITRPNQFHISSNENIMIPTMRGTIEAAYYEDDSVKAIKLPYIGNEIEMVIILPRTRFGLSDVLKTLTGEKLLKYVREASITEVAISLPKFRAEEKVDLRSVVESIGITDIFNAGADFGSLTTDEIPIYVGKIMHAGFIEIDEKGTESAASTVVELSNRMFADKTFKANEPFLFAIVKDMKTVLFAGKFVK